MAVTPQLTVKVTELLAGKSGSNEPVVKNGVVPAAVGTPKAMPAGHAAPPSNCAHVTDVQLRPDDAESDTRLLLAGHTPVLAKVTVYDVVAPATSEFVAFVLVALKFVGQRA